MAKLIIFDFDGTVVDTKQVYYNSMNKHLNLIGFSKKQVDEAIDLGMNVAETVKRFVPSWPFSWWIKRKIMADVLKEANEIHKCRDVGAIKEIKARKILVSNSLGDFVIPILKHLRIKDYFDEIYYADEFDNKADFIKDYLKKKKINPKDCFYVGDRVADARLAKRVGCRSIIVLGKCAWDSRKEIMKAEPDYVVSDLKDVKRIVEKFILEELKKGRYPSGIEIGKHFGISRIWNIVKVSDLYRELGLKSYLERGKGSRTKFTSV